MNILDLISSTGEGGADQSWWDTIGFGDIDFGSWDKVLSDLPDDWWTSIDIDPADVVSGDKAWWEEMTPEDAAKTLAKVEEGIVGTDGSGAGLFNFVKKIFTDDKGNVNPLGIIGATALLPKLFGDSKSSTPPPSGYQGGIPKYTAVRERVAGTTDPTRRSGSGGRRYFSDISYTPKTDTSAVDAARAAASEQATGLESLNKANPAYEKRPKSVLPAGKTGAPVTRPTAASGVADLLPVMEPKLIEQYMADKAFVGPRQQTDDAYEIVKFDKPPSSTAMPSVSSDISTSLYALANKSPAQQTDQQSGLGAIAGGTIPPGLVLPHDRGQDLPGVDYGALYADAAKRGSATSLEALLAPPSYDTKPIGVESNTAPTTTQPPITAARGGLMNLARGRYLNGDSDGMADKIPATIEDKQPARLSHGEFVVPADVVSHLGNGNSEAGAQRLYSMMDKIRKARTGTTKQGKQINPNKYLPA
jgi:hypothetical protein